MSVYKVDICGVTTSKLPVLKDDEKEELFEKIKKGDKAAREKYIRGNLRLVLSVIRRFSNHNENMDDLFQIGCIGLMKSIDNFDPTRMVMKKRRHHTFCCAMPSYASFLTVYSATVR